MLKKITDWQRVFEAIGLVAIIASLVFVGVQLRQDQVIARSELTSESFTLLMELDGRLLDSEFAAVYVKMLAGEEDLTLQDTLQLDSLLRTVVYVYQRDCFMKARGIYVECEAIVNASVGKFFGNWYAQSWWKRNGAALVGDGDFGSLPRWVDEKITAVDSVAHREMIEDIATRD